MESSAKHLPYGKKGLYSEATKGCFLVFSRMSDSVVQAVQDRLEARKNEAPQPFRVLDLGCADAGTSLPLVHRICQLVRKAEPTTPIEIVYEDQRTNDWTCVFERASSRIPTSLAPAKDLADYGNVFVLATGTSFYRQCVAKDSVDVAFSSTAMHWLTSAPCVIPDALHSAFTKDPDVKAEFRKRGVEDMATIFRHRLAELKPGARFVLTNFSIDAKGQCLGRTANTKASMHDTFASLWRAIAGDEIFRATNFPNQYRTRAEHVEALPEMLVLKSYEDRLVRCPFHEKYMSGEYETAQTYADDYVETTRTWSNSTFLAGALTFVGREDARGMVDELFRRYKECIAQNPADHGMDYVHGYMVLEKVPH